MTGSVTGSPRIAYDACPLCGLKPGLLRVADCDWHALYKEGLGPTMRWLRCLSCGHVFVDGYFTEEALALLFTGTHAAQRPGADLESQRQVWAPSIERVVRHLPEPPRSWLDVGFGNGVLLLTAAEWGFWPVGLDLRPDTVLQLREFGVETHLQDLADHVPSQGYQVVSMCDVLEHLPYPKQALEHVRTIMAADGVLVLSMPSFDSPAWRMLDRAGNNPYWGELEHYHNFSRERLTELLEETGFSFLQYAVSPRWRITMEVLARPS
jgi:SAM-dependent methyltransferase